MDKAEIRRKIGLLSKVTQKNGATKAEAENAQDTINSLQNKLRDRDERKAIEGLRNLFGKWSKDFQIEKTLPKEWVYNDDEDI